MSSICQQLKQEYQALKLKKQEFDSALEKARATEALDDIKQARKIMKELKEKREALMEKLGPKEITGQWQNPETNETKEITINIKKEVEYFKNFYERLLNLQINEKEVKDIWRKNHKEIKKEIKTYGYDTILIIPENLPDEEELNEKLIETMKGYRCLSCNGEHTNACQGSNFKEGGSFKGVKNTEKPKLRIVLTENIQNTSKSGDPIIEATLRKDIMELTGLSDEEVEKRIANQEPLPINFETEIQGKKIRIQAEGLSLDEYLVFQRVYFEKNQKHLDEEGWTWLLKSLSGSRLVDSRWFTGLRRFYVDADDLDYDGDLGTRLSRSFSLF